MNDLDEYKEKDIPEKVERLVSVLRERRVIVAFDGFEEQVEDGTVRDEGLKLFLERVVTERVKGKVVITSKIRFEILEGRYSGCVVDIKVEGFYEEESLRYLNNFKVEGLTKDEKIRLHAKTDGHPYALEIFVALTHTFTVEELLEDESLYVGEFEKKFVGKLLSALGPEERETLERCAVFDAPVPMKAFEFVGAAKKYVEELVGLNLVKFDRGSGLYKVQSTTREVVLSKLGKDVKGLHVKAAQFWEGRAKDTRNIWDIVRAQEHYYEAGEYKKAGEIVNWIAEYLHLWGYVRLSKVFLERLEDKTDGLVRVGILHNLGITTYLLGDYGEALKKY